MNLYNIFMKILNMSMMASFVIAAVLLVRILMRRFPKKYSFLLWLAVAVRLVCPVALSSPFSIFNLDHANVTDRYMAEAGIGADAMKQESYESRSKSAAGQSGKYSFMEVDGQSEEQQNASPTGQQERLKPESDAEKEAADTVWGDNALHVAAVVWLIGIGVILLWNICLVIRMKRHLQKAVKYRDNIYECDNIASPFVMGLVRPRIYIPFRLMARERAYILMHEQYHIKRRDYITKVLAFLIAAVHWFNPLVWGAYLCMARDMEMSCDEHVLGKMGTDIKKDYSKSLLSFAANQRQFSAGMLAFGETGTRRRVKNILSFKKKGKWIGMLGIAIVVIVSVVCLTNKTLPEASKNNEEKPSNAQKAQPYEESSDKADNQEVQPLDNTDAQPSENLQNAQNPGERMNPERILFVDGKYYYGTYETGPMGDADAVAGHIKTSIDENSIPFNDAESNFGCVGNPYTYDYGEGWIQVLLEDGEYHIFVIGDMDKMLPSTTENNKKDKDKGQDERLWLGYITSLSESDGIMQIEFDYVEWVVDEKEPNGFRLENPKKERDVFAISGDAEYRIIAYYAAQYDGIPLWGEESSHSLVGKEQFVQYLNDIHERDLQNGSDVSTPFWITEKDGVIVRILEQYVP